MNFLASVANVFVYIMILCVLPVLGMNNSTDKPSLLELAAVSTVATVAMAMATSPMEIDDPGGNTKMTIDWTGSCRHNDEIMAGPDGRQCPVVRSADRTMSCDLSIEFPNRNAANMFISYQGDLFKFTLTQSGKTVCVPKTYVVLRKSPVKTSFMNQQFGRQIKGEISYVFGRYPAEDSSGDTISLDDHSKMSTNGNTVHLTFAVKTTIISEKIKKTRIPFKLEVQGLAPVLKDLSADTGEYMFVSHANPAIFKGVEWHPINPANTDRDTFGPGDQVYLVPNKNVSSKSTGCTSLLHALLFPELNKENGVELERKGIPNAFFNDTGLSNGFMFQLPTVLPDGKYTIQIYLKGSGKYAKSQEIPPHSIEVVSEAPLQAITQGVNTTDMTNGVQSLVVQSQVVQSQVVWSVSYTDKNNGDATYVPHELCPGEGYTTATDGIFNKLYHNPAGMMIFGNESNYTSRSKREGRLIMICPTLSRDQPIPNALIDTTDKSNVQTKTILPHSGAEQYIFQIAHDKVRDYMETKGVTRNSAAAALLAFNFVFTPDDGSNPIRSVDCHLRAKAHELSELSMDFKTAAHCFYNLAPNVYAVEFPHAGLYSHCIVYKTLDDGKVHQLLRTQYLKIVAFNNVHLVVFEIPNEFEVAGIAIMTTKNKQLSETLAACGSFLTEEQQQVLNAMVPSERGASKTVKPLNTQKSPANKSLANEDIKKNSVKTMAVAIPDPNTLDPIPGCPEVELIPVTELSPKAKPCCVTCETTEEGLNQILEQYKGCDFIVKNVTKPGYRNVGNLFEAAPVISGSQSLGISREQMLQAFDDGFFKRNPCVIRPMDATPVLPSLEWISNDLLDWLNPCTSNDIEPNAKRKKPN